MNIKRNTVMVVILGLSLLLNLYGIDWGLPVHWYPDEYEAIDKTVIPMAMNLDPNPHYFMKPSLYYYFLELVLSPYFLYIKAFHVSLEPFQDFIGHVTLIARIITALVGAACVFLVSRIGKNLKHPDGGALSALLLAINLPFISYSHLAYYDVPMIFLLLYSFLFILRFMDVPEKKLLFLASLFGGLAVSTKYNALIPLETGLIIGYLFFWRSMKRKTENPSEGRTSDFIKMIVISQIIAGGAFFLATPFAILDFRTFITDFVKQIYTTRGYGIFGGETAFWNNAGILKDTLGLPLLFLCALGILGGCVRLIRNPEWKRAVLLFTPLLYFIYIGTWQIGEIRYMLPILPFLLVLVTDSFFEIQSLMYRRQWVSWLILGTVLLYSAVYSVRNVRFFGSDSRQSATEFIEEKVNQGSRIEVYAYSSYLPRFGSGLEVKRLQPDFVETLAGLEALKASRIGRLLLGDQQDPGIPREDNLGSFTPGALALRNPDFIVLSSYYYERFIHIENPADERYSALKSYFEGLVSGRMGYSTAAIFRRDNRVMRHFYLNPTIIILERVPQEASG